MLGSTSRLFVFLKAGLDGESVADGASPHYPAYSRRNKSGGGTKWVVGRFGSSSASPVEFACLLEMVHDLAATDVEAQGADAVSMKLLYQPG